MAQSVVGALRVVLGLDAAEFQKGLVAAQGEMKRVGRELSRLGGEMQRAGQALTVGLSAPLAALGVTSIKTAGNFEAAMIRVKIATSATSGEMEKMSRLARQIGKDTIFSASEAAGAMEELAKSGVSTTSILNGAARATVNLAAATGSQLEPAAHAITDVMQVFGKTTADLPNIVDTITGSVNTSKFAFEDFQLAMAQGGGRAAALGVSFEDFAASLAGTSAQFTSGSDAGTSFGTFLQRLVPGSKEAEQAMKALGFSVYTASGQLRPMAEIAEELKKRFGDLSDEKLSTAMTTIFGADAFRTAVGLTQLGADGLNKVAEAIAKVDAAAQAAERMKGFNAQMEQLGGAFEELAIRLGESGFLGAVTGVVQAITGLIEWVAALPAPLTAVAISVGAVAAVIGPAILLAGAFTASLGAIATASTNAGLAAGGLSLALKGLSASMRFLLGPWGLAITGIAVAVGYLVAKTREATPAQKALKKAVDDVTTAKGKYEDAVRLAAAATGQEKVKALELVRAQRLELENRLKLARAALAQAQAQAVQIASYRQSLAHMGGYGAAGGTGLANSRAAAIDLEQRIRQSTDAAKAEIAAAQTSLNDFEKSLNRPIDVGGGRNIDLSGSDGAGRKSKDDAAEEAKQRARTIEDMAHEIDLQEATLRNDLDRVRVLEREDAVRQRVRALMDAGIIKDKAAAQEEAERVQKRLDAAITEQQIREEKTGRRDWEKSLWQMDGRQDRLAVIEREEMMEERIAYWRARNKDLVTATSIATSELLEYDVARAEAAERSVKAREAEHAIEVARLSGNQREFRRLSREADVVERTNRYMSDRDNPMTPSAARAQAQQDVEELDSAEAQGKVRSFFQDGLRAAMDGNLSDFAKGWVKDWASQGLENALNSLGALLKRLFGSIKFGGDGGGFNLAGIGKTVGSFMSKIPGFATGGSFKVGGSGAADSKLVSMRLTPGEMVDIRRPGADAGAGGGRPYFDLRGAVLTRDLLQQMNVIGETHGIRAGSQALDASRKIVPAEQFRKQRYSF